jgi:putative membrane protein
MKTKGWIIATLAASAIAWSCDNNDDNKKSLPETDRTFVQKAALGNMTEVSFATMAQANASNDEVKAFAQQMISEHTDAQNELKDLANKYDNVSWPTDMDDQHKQLRDQLNGMTGHAFDSAYVASQVSDHETVLAAFQAETSGGENADIKAYANKYQPHIQEHLTKAQALKAMLEVTMTNGGRKGN